MVEEHASEYQGIKPFSVALDTKYTEYQGIKPFSVALEY